LSNLTEKKYINLKYVVYDIETLKNCFTCCFLDYDSKKKKEFVIHNSRNDFKDFIKFLIKLKQNNYYFVGFNNLFFDSQILQYIFEKRNIFEKLSADEITSKIYEKTQEIIALQNLDDKYLYLISEWQQIFPQIDLFKQKHYDGKAKRGTSLKWIEFTIGFNNVEEMPIHHSDVITVEQIPLILSYNWNDVEATAKFFELIKFETDLRIELSNEYNLPLLNSSEPRLAKEIFAKILSEKSGINKKDLKKMKTIRNNIKVSDIIFDYITFETEPLQNLLKQIKALNIDPNNMKNSFEKVFTYHGIETVMGLGGIHACCNPGIYKSRKDLIIHDLDVTSFYPNLAIQNDLKPAHLGDSFMEVYNNIFQERKKIPKANPINYVFKIILNSTYGLSNEPNSYLYDPLFTMSITLNGQLLILKLVEMLILAMPEIVIYQENTDGISIGYNPEKKYIVDSICKEWEKLTKLELESAFYKQMIIMDVNNYIAESEDGKLKRKGLFEYKMDFHKNPSFLIIPKAIEQYFINNVNVEDFIKNHNNIYDFLGAIKSTKDFILNLYFIKDRSFIKEKQEKVCRYFISNKGGKLIKDFKDSRRERVHAKELQTCLNKIVDEDVKSYDINYKFYIKEVHKIINLIEKPVGIQSSLFNL